MITDFIYKGWTTMPWGPVYINDGVDFGINSETYNNARDIVKDLDYKNIKLNIKDQIEDGNRNQEVINESIKYEALMSEKAKELNIPQESIDKYNEVMKDYVNGYPEHRTFIGVYARLSGLSSRETEEIIARDHINRQLGREVNYNPLTASEKEIKEESYQYIRENFLKETDLYDKYPTLKEVDAQRTFEQRDIALNRLLREATTSFDEVSLVKGVRELSIRDSAKVNNLFEDKNFEKYTRLNIATAQELAKKDADGKDVITLYRGDKMEEIGNVNTFTKFMQDEDSKELLYRNINNLTPFTSQKEIATHFGNTNYWYKNRISRPNITASMIIKKDIPVKNIVAHWLPLASLTKQTDTIDTNEYLVKGEIKLTKDNFIKASMTDRFKDKYNLL